MRDGLGAVDGASAAHGEHAVALLAPREVNALVHLGVTRVGHRTAQQHAGNARLVQRLGDLLHQSGADYRAAAVVNQRAGAAQRLQLLARVALRAAAKDELRGNLPVEIQHSITFIS